MNKCFIMGNLGKDPEVKVLESGKKLAKFSVATSRSYKNASGERITDTEWHNIVAWGKTAEIIEKYLQKGSKVLVEGRLVNRNYEDKQGIKRYVTEIHCEEITFISGPKEKQNTPDANNTSSNESVNNKSENDDLPF